MACKLNIIELTHIMMVQYTPQRWSDPVTGKGTRHYLKLIVYAPYGNTHYLNLIIYALYSKDLMHNM